MNNIISLINNINCIYNVKEHLNNTLYEIIKKQTKDLIYW